MKIILLSKDEGELRSFKYIPGSFYLELTIQQSDYRLRPCILQQYLHEYRQLKTKCAGGLAVNIG